MNNKIATGIWLVFIGLVVLLHNLHVIDFNFIGAIKYWPLLLVSIGIGFLLQNRKNTAWILTACNIIICSFIFYQGVTSKDTIFDSFTAVSDDAEFIPANSIGKSSEGIAERITLKFNGGAAKYIMNTDISTDSLFRASTDSPNSSLSLSNTDEINNFTINTQIKSSKYAKNKIFVGLNPNHIWDLEYNIGAASISADFKKLKLGSLSINSGATSLDMYLPVPIEGDHLIDINTAASSIKLFLPKGADCSVETDSFLSSNKFEDVDISDDKIRKTSGYDKSNSRYTIKVDGAANSLTILRY